MLCGRISYIRFFLYILIIVEIIESCISISISNVYMNIRYVCDEDIREKERAYTITACFLLCIYIYIFLPSFHHPTVQSINRHKRNNKSNGEI